MENNSHILDFPFLLFSLFSPTFFRSFFILSRSAPSRSVPFRFRNFAPVPAIYWFETVVPCLDRLKPEQWNGDGRSRSDIAFPAKNGRAGEPSHPFAIPANTMAIKAISALVFVAMMATSIVAAQNPNGMVQVNGTLYCTGDDSRGGSGDAAPVFPDAVVQVSCTANVISNSPVTTTKNSDGAYVLALAPQPSASIESIIANCRIFVRTPISSCNAELASPGLVSNLQSLKTVPGGSSVITYMVFIHHQHDYCRFLAPRLSARLGHQVIVWICLMLE